MRLNLSPAFNLARAAMPRLLERGGGRVRRACRRARRCEPFPGRRRATRPPRRPCSPSIQALDADYRTKGIRANAILPSVIDTPANRAAEPDADHSKWVQPAEIARVVRFLVSDDSAVDERRRDSRLRPRVVRQGALAELLGDAAVLNGSDRRADERDRACPRSAAPCASREVPRELQWSAFGPSRD